MAESRFVYVTYIRTTPEKLWRALIDPESTRRFLVETWQESEWKPRASWRMMVPDGRVHSTGEVLEIEPGRRLVLSWHCELFPEVRAEGPSRVSYELEEAGKVAKQDDHLAQRCHSCLSAQVLRNQRLVSRSTARLPNPCVAGLLSAGGGENGVKAASLATFWQP